MADISKIQLNELLLNLKDAAARSQSSGGSVPSWVAKMTMKDGTLSSGDPSNGIDTFQSYNLKASNRVVSHSGEIDSLQVISAVATSGFFIGDNPVPDWEQGQWTPRLFNTASNEITSAIDAVSGFYYRVKDLIFIEGFIISSSLYACHHVAGLPYEPHHGRPTTLYPMSIYGQPSDGAPNSSACDFNRITGSSTYYVQNGAYASGKTLKNWYITGFYRKAS